MTAPIEPPLHKAGLCLDPRMQALADRLGARGVPFLPPHVRFEGQVGEQGTFFVRDPAGHALEFKSFKDPARLFASAYSGGLP